MAGLLVGERRPKRATQTPIRLPECKRNCPWPALRGTSELALLWGYFGYARPPSPGRNERDFYTQYTEMGTNEKGKQEGNVSMPITGEIGRASCRERGEIQSVGRVVTK